MSGDNAVITITSSEGINISGLALLLGNSGIETHDSSVSFEDMLIQNNNRAGNGGGAAFLDLSDAFMRRCVISSNSATESGGGIYVSGGSSLSLEDSIVSTNSAGTEDSSDQKGGGIYGDYDDNEDMGSNLVITNSLVIDNAANGFGGGIGTGAHSALFMTDSYIFLNAAMGPEPEEEERNETSGGGGICMGEYSTLMLVGGEVSDNVTNGSGGGFYFDAFCDTTILDATIANNKGTTEFSWGGGIHGGDFQRGLIKGCRIMYNSAQVGGGVVFPYKCWTRMEWNEVICNHAVQYDEPEEEEPRRREEQALLACYAPGILSIDSASDFINNTIVYSQVLEEDEPLNRPTGSLHIVSPILNPEVVDNIFAYNRHAWGIYCDGGVLDRIEYNAFYENDKGPCSGCFPEPDWFTSVLDDPQFIDIDGPDNIPWTWEDNDFNLFYLNDTTKSPCIDAGDPAFVVPEGGGTCVDMGANEYIYDDKAGLAGPRRSPAVDSNGRND